jgi:hypothetical protein
MARAAMRADDVEHAVGIGDALAVELAETALLRAADRRLAPERGWCGVTDQWDAALGLDRALRQRRELGGLALVVDDEAAILAAGGRAAGNAADIIGRLALLAGEIGRRLDLVVRLQCFGEDGIRREQAEHEGGQEREPHGLAPAESCEIGVGTVVAKTGL